MPALRGRALLSALPYVLQSRYEREVYEHYTAKALQTLTENTSRPMSPGSYIQRGYSELLRPQREDTRTADDVIGGIKSRLRQIGGEE